MTPVSRQDLIIRTPEGFVQGAVAYGVTRQRLLQLFQYGEQRKIDPRDPDLKEKIKNLSPEEVVFGVGLASSTGIFRDDRIALIPPEALLLPSGEIPRLSKALVRGFINTDIERIDNQSFFYIIGESLYNFRNTASETLSLEVWLKDPDQAENVKRQLKSSGINSEGVNIETWQSRNASLFFCFEDGKNSDWPSCCPKHFNCRAFHYIGDGSPFNPKEKGCGPSSHHGFDSEQDKKAFCQYWSLPGSFWDFFGSVHRKPWKCSH